MTRRRLPRPVSVLGVARTPLAPAEGALAGWHPVHLTALVLDALADVANRVGGIDEVWVGCAEPVGAQGADLARAAVVASSLADATAAFVVDGAEVSGSAALRAGAGVAAGGSRVAVVGVGVASVVPDGASALGRLYGRPWGDALEERLPGSVLPPERLAERAAARAGIDEADLVDWARRSRERREAAASATAAGRLVVDERPPGLAPSRRGDPRRDDVVRRDPLDGLPPLFDDDGLLTAATVALAGDGAAGVLLAPAPGDATADTVLVDVATGAGDPLDPVAGLEPAVTAVWPPAGTTADLHAVVMGEPDAATAVLAARRLAALGIDPGRVSPHGGALASARPGAADVAARLVDALVAGPPGSLVLGVDTGPTGTVATLWRIGDLAPVAEPVGA